MNTKQCRLCGKVKETTQFSKKKASPDGLQTRCKDCNRIDNEKFRKVINPEHHAVWQKVNKKYICDMVKKYRRADKGKFIYYISNPNSQIYVGATEMYPNVRWLEHKQRWKKLKKGQPAASIPLLDASFDKWGLEAHTFGIIVEFDNISKTELHAWERRFIKGFKNLGNSLNIKG